MSSKYWADELAEKTMARHSEPYVVSDWKTPSGRIHFGALEGVVLHEAVARAIKKSGHSVRYIYGFDDFDPFDKIPPYLNKEAYEQYLGQPMTSVPQADEAGMPIGEPTKEHNYARVFADEFESVYRQMGVESETLRSTDLYKDGTFNDAIRLALDHAKEIRQAYEDIAAHRSADRVNVVLADEFPLNVVCENCGKHATTEVTDWNGEQVIYQCQAGRHTSPYVDGCGHAGSVSPFDGHGKLPWKVEWAAKWFTFHSDIEGAGKDHYTKGGSRDTSSEIFRRVYLPALDTEHAKLPEDLFYEWIYLGGLKMSTSKGIGLSAKDVAAAVPIELLRFLMVRKKPRTGANFELSLDTVARLYDEYDRILLLANADRNSYEAAIMRAAVVEDQEFPDYVFRFSKLYSLITTAAKSDEFIRDTAADEKGAALTQEETIELDRRILFAREWANQHKVESTESVPAELSETQRAFLVALVEKLKQVDEVNWNAEFLPNEVFEVRKASEVSSKEAFQAIYRTLLGADAGPRVGDLFVQRGKETILMELTQETK